MFDLSKWTGDVHAGPFRFSRSPEPLVVVSRRRIVKPTPDGPVEVGRLTRIFRDGKPVGEAER